jgi:hypothetical protein
VSFSVILHFVGVVGTDVAEERITSIFGLENSEKEENPKIFFAL